MGHVGKIATHVLLAALALLVGRYLVIDMPFTLDTLVQAGYYGLGALIVELLFRVERAPWRFVSASDHLRLFRSAVLTAVAFLFITRFVHRGIDGGLRMVAGAALIQATFLSALRVIRRSLHERQLFDSVLRLGPASMQPALPRLLIIGSATEAEAFLRSPAGLGERYTPIGVVSPMDRETGDELRGVCVLGAIADFDRVLARLRDSGLSPSAILFLTDSAMSTFGAERLGRLKTEGVRLLRRHGVVEMGADTAAVAVLREISIEELLSRPPVRLDPEPVRALVSGRRVLVTGAGGSIGSELCRQIAASGCAHLTMVDASEYNLFHIDREMAQTWPSMPRRELLCDVRDAARVQRVFTEQHPDIIFHAAALKHVTLVENHPCEGVRTNVLGTRNVAIAAKACGAAHLALISTDKAVAPTSVMGAAKRVAEAVARQYGGGGDMRVSIVRFGNVLGSAGSVVPIFQSQIARGGPITLTDAAVERYFMTIPEAVQLVLRAVALSRIASEPDAGVLTLEMGEPVKIIDLATRMIELQGLTPGKDIDIQITGLRPGEKLTETLVDVNEVARPKAPGIMEALRLSDAPVIADERLEALDALAEIGDETAVRAALFDLVEDLRQVGPSKVVKIRAS